MISKKTVLVEINKQIDISDALWIPQGDDIFSTTYSYSSEEINFSYGVGGWGIFPYGASGTLAIAETREPILKLGSLQIKESFYYEVETYEELVADEYTFLWENQILYCHTPNGANPRSFGYTSIGTGKFFSTHSDWYDDIYYDGRLLSIPSIIRSTDNMYKGVASFEGGAIEFVNSDGYFDDAKDLSLYGQKVRIYFAEDDDEFTQVYEGVIESFTRGQETFIIETIDPRKALNKKLPNENWSLNDYPNIEDGKDEDYMPLCYGRLKNVPVVCTNKEEDDLTTYIFKITNREIHSIDAVYVDGEEVTFSDADLEETTFTLSSDVYENSQEVTADIKGFVDEGVLIENPADIILDLITYYTSAFYSPVVFDTDEWETVRNSGLPICNLYEDNPNEIMDLITLLCNSIFVNFIILGDGRYTLKQKDFDKNPIKTIYISDQLDKFELTDNSDEYVSSVEVGYNKDYDEDEFSYYIDRSQEEDLYAEYLTYNHVDFETQLVNEEDAQSFASEILSTFGGHYETISIVTSTQHIDLELEDLVDVELYGMDNGEEEFYGTIRIEITSLEHNFTDNTITIEGRYVKDVTSSINLYKLLRYNKERQYSDGSVTSAGGQLWRALQPTTGNLPEVDSEFWERYLSINWNANTQYYTGNMVLDGDALYVASADNINKQPSENSDVWDTYIDTLPQGPEGEKGDSGWSGTAYDSEYTYSADELCIESGNAWVSQTDDNTGNTPSEDDGTHWKNFFADTTPIGSVIAWTCDTIPNGYLKLDGSLVPIADYPLLYEYFGTKFGGDGVTTFALPDAQGLTLAGHGIQIVNERTKGEEDAKLLDIREDEMQGHRHKFARYHGAYANDENDRTCFTPSGSYSGYVLDPETDGENGTPRLGPETHGPQLLVHYIVKARHTNSIEFTDPNIDQRLVDVENKLNGFDLYNTDWIDLSDGKAGRTLLLTHNLNLSLDELEIHTFWKNSSTGDIIKQGEGSTYSGTSGYTYYYVNDVQIKFQHASTSYSGITYEGDSTGTARWNDLNATYGHDMVKIVIRPLEIYGLKGEDGADGADGTNGTDGVDGTTVPDISGLTEITSLAELDDELIIYDTSSSSHKKIKTSNLKDNYVTEIIGNNMYRQWFVKMADGTYRGFCGGSTGSNCLMGNGLTDRNIKNQPWPLIPEKKGCSIKQIDVQGVIAAVLYEDGDLYNCGYSGAGQQGQGNTTQQNYFVKSAENVNRFWLSKYQNYSHNYTHWFYEDDDGTIYGCGHNSSGELGLGTTTNATSWTQITFFDDLTVLEMYPMGASNGLSLATTSDGSIWYTGDNTFGESGNGATTDLVSWTDITTYWGGPTTETAGNIVTVVGGINYYTGSAHNASASIAMLREDGYVRTCGDNGWGQIGNGTTTDVHTPHTVDIYQSNLSGTEECFVVDLKLIGSAPCSLWALTDEGKVYRWGYNGQGQIGDGTTTTVTSPYNSNTDLPTVSYEIDCNCSEILLDNCGGQDYGYQVIQCLKDSRDDSLWVTGESANFLTGLGTGTDQTTFTHIFFDDSVNVIQARLLGHGNVNKWALFLDDKGRVWATGENGSYELSRASYYSTADWPVPTIMEIK